MITGGPVGDDFREGWACHPYLSWKAHFFSINGFFSSRSFTRYVTAKCGFERPVNNVFPLLEPGDFPKCKRCESILRKQK